MCGIVGYIGESQAAPILLDGLSKLEYRGYDSAGIAVYDGEQIRVQKAVGRLKVLSELTHDGATMPGTSGIGHTRWATHGAPSSSNEPYRKVFPCLYQPISQALSGQEIKVKMWLDPIYNYRIP